MNSELFETTEGEIEWSYMGQDHPDLELRGLTDQKAVMLEHIQTEDPGNGGGTRLLTSFIAKMKEQKVDLIYLWAVYDSEAFTEAQTQDPIKGHQRIITFYERLGFETLERPELGEGFMVDMILNLN